MLTADRTEVAAMAEAILLVGDSERDQDLYYKTHFLAGDPFLYVEVDGHPVLLVNSMELGRAKKESIVDDVRSWDQYNFKELVKQEGDVHKAYARFMRDVLSDLGADHVVVSSTFPAIYADELRARGVDVSFNTEMFRMQRRIKSADELAAIEEAQRATERSCMRAIDILRASEDRKGMLLYDGIPLTSERLRSEIELSLLRDNMDTTLSPIVAAGPGAADPHWRGEGPIKAGQALVLDIFPRSKKTRYFADMTRTVVKGDPGEQLRNMYDAVLASQEAAFRELRPGANARVVHEAVEAVFEERGFTGDGPGPRYIHSTGHGLGLDIHEPLGLGTRDEELLEGDVVTVEPGLYDPDIGGIRIEDMVVITDDGYRNLTQMSKRFQV